MSRAGQHKRSDERKRQMEPLALKVGCPTCGAKKGKYCYVQGSFENGGEYTLPHGPRIQKALQP